MVSNRDYKRARGVPPRSDSNKPEATIGRWLLITRLTTGIIVGIPSLALLPFAAWLALASALQLAFSPTPLGLATFLVAISGVIGCSCLWWYVILGNARGAFGVVQLFGIFLGACALGIVIAVQFFMDNLSSV